MARRDRNAKWKTSKSQQGSGNVGRYEGCLFKGSLLTSSLWQSYIVSGKDYPRVELDTHGCGLRCSALSDPSQDLQFIVAGDECVYLYQPDERGPCFAFEGHKLIVHWFRGYLVIVSRDRKVSPK